MAGDLILARVIHILAAAVWIGGTVFLAAVAVPYARTLDDQRRTEVVTALGRRFRPVAWTALVLSAARGVHDDRFGRRPGRSSRRPSTERACSSSSDSSA